MAEHAGAGRREAAAVGALAVGLGAWAVIGSHWLHPHLTRNADEATYLQQAAALASGHLTAAPPGDVRTFQPWFATVRDGRYVFKYTPVWPAVLAVGRVLGSPRIGLFVAAAAAVVGAYLLAREVVASHQRALAAAALFAIAPLTVSLSTTFLSYVWFSALWTFTGWAVLRAARTGRHWTALGAGVLAGVTLFARPYEALLVLAPFAVWVVGDGRGAPAALGRRLAWIALGAAGPIALFLATNAALTGSPLHTTLTLWDPLDRPGFGPRRILGSGPPQVDFTVRDGVVGVVKHGAQLEWWTAGGIVLGALAIVGVTAAWRRRGVLPVAAVAVTVPLGFVFYWGPYSVASLFPGFSRAIGPLYVVPLVVPVCILAVEGFAAVRVRSHAVAVAAAALVAAVFMVNVVRALDLNLDARRDRERHNDALEHLDPSARTLVLVTTWSKYLGTGPNGALVNVRTNPRTLYASARSPASDLATVEEFPHRTPYRLVRRGATTDLERLDRETARSLPLIVDVDTLGAKTAAVEIGSGDRASTTELPPEALAARSATLPVVVEPNGVEIGGGGPATTAPRDPAKRDALTITVRLGDVPGDAPGRTRQYRWKVAERVDPNGLTLLFPPTTTRNLGAPGERFVRAPVRDALRVTRV